VTEGYTREAGRIIVVINKIAPFPQALAVLAVFILGCFVAGHALKFISDLRSENSKKHLRVIQLEVELVRLGHEVPPRPAAR
jgi:hypothetical protein